MPHRFTGVASPMTHWRMTDPFYERISHPFDHSPAAIPVTFREQTIRLRFKTGAALSNKARIADKLFCSTGKFTGDFRRRFKKDLLSYKLDTASSPFRR